MDMDVVKVREVACSCCFSILQLLANIKIKIRCATNGGVFRSDREQPQWCMEDITRWPNHVHDLLSHIFDTEENDRQLLWNLIISLPNEKTVIKILGTFRDFCLLCQDMVTRWSPIPDLCPSLPSCSVKENRLGLCILSNNRLRLTWRFGDPRQDVLSAVEDMLDAIRREGRPPTCDEYFATHLAYLCIRKGTRTRTNRACPLGVPGFHPYTQTYMSLTNPGEGHVQGTTRCPDWLEGVLVHVEYIERPRAVQDRVPAYRMPSCLDLARVRLHTGAAAPTTCYIGCFHADPATLDNDPVTVVHSVANSASLAFSHGAAECKISMFGLSTSQALKLMEMVGAQVQKTPHQSLSAAWSLTQTLLDDLTPTASGQKQKTYLTKPADIAMKAVEVTAQGGFQKVTWDGSGQASPSKCILQQLGYQDALNVVHVAHERGLLTYFSAGFRLDDIPSAVFTGVDGIGIGGVLHFMDRDTGILGPYKEEDIPQVLAKRDEAAEHILGQGAQLLARLDSMYHEGSISHRHNALRLKLFRALMDRREPEIDDLISQLEEVSALASENFQPFLHRAKRLMEAENPMMRHSCSQGQWEELRKLLEPLLPRQGDEDKVMEEYEADPWVSMRKDWHKTQGLPSCAKLLMRRREMEQ